MTSIASRVRIVQGDITKLKTDAIVNAANRSLLGGGGVDGAIHRAAGPELFKECRTIKGCKTGDAKITHGYNLPATWIIHTVGPNLNAGDDKEKLRDAYQNSLNLAIDTKEIKTIAFPCISTGIYGYPQEEAAHIALEVTRKTLKEYEILEEVIFCVFLDSDREIYERLKPVYFPDDEKIRQNQIEDSGDDLILPEVPTKKRKEEKTAEIQEEETLTKADVLLKTVVNYEL
ncbi:unnamed protein product [Oikopleura dioica]|uniref:Macro domain-containing protein n=1 Tax=Oikopleura dioica TaxID=34765 RepID=E4YJZ1_OIKDI|nr:unnamed protein product [Oikopleura dioica]